ncbi:hypothetical protein LTR08_007572 [Meristemomyces frigidus]|nr:hypothetical protein LTR08_007572 [Meristemomyces frigidus]
MSSSAPLRLILGTGSVGSPTLSGTTAAKFLDTFREHDYTELDSAYVYPMVGTPGECERVLSQVGPWAHISTKILPPFDRENVAISIEGSVERLGGKEIDILYLHLPDRSTPMEETLEAVDAAHRAGKFKRFGVSNYSPQEVQKLVEVCASNGFVKPTVYQGQYNLLARKGEKELFPILREHGIAFCAYSPAAGGMLTGKVTRESADQDGRWSKASPGGQAYSAAYHQDLIFEASTKIQNKAKEHGISGHAAALRWCIHHSVLDVKNGDAVIVGASSVGQLEEGLKICEEGPLPTDLVKAIEEVWPTVQAVAPWA